MAIEANWFKHIPSRKSNISHLGKRKIIFKMDFSGDMLVPRRVSPPLLYIHLYYCWVSRDFRDGFMSWHHSILLGTQTGCVKSCSCTRRFGPQKIQWMKFPPQNQTSKSHHIYCTMWILGELYQTRICHARKKWPKCDSHFFIVAMDSHDRSYSNCLFGSV